MARNPPRCRSGIDCRNPGSHGCLWRHRADRTNFDARLKTQGRSLNFERSSSSLYKTPKLSRLRLGCPLGRYSIGSEVACAGVSSTCFSEHQSDKSKINLLWEVAHG